MILLLTPIKPLELSPRIRFKARFRAPAGDSIADFQRIRAIQGGYSGNILNNPAALIPNNPAAAKTATQPRPSGATSKTTTRSKTAILGIGNDRYDPFDILTKFKSKEQKS